MISFTLLLIGLWKRDSLNHSMNSASSWLAEDGSWLVLELGSVIAQVLVFRQSKTVLLIISLFKCHGLWSRAQVLSLLRRLQTKLNEVKLDK